MGARPLTMVEKMSFSAFGLEGGDSEENLKERECVVELETSSLEF